MYTVGFQSGQAWEPHSVRFLVNLINSQKIFAKVPKKSKYSSSQRHSYIQYAQVPVVNFSISIGITLREKTSGNIFLTRETIWCSKEQLLPLKIANFQKTCIGFAHFVCLLKTHGIPKLVIIAISIFTECSLVEPELQFFSRVNNIQFL